MSWDCCIAESLNIYMVLLYDFYVWMSKTSKVDKRGTFNQFWILFRFSPSEGYLPLRILYSKYHAREKIPSLNSLWRHVCNSELLGFFIQPMVKERKMTYNSVDHYFEFYRANLNGEKKNTERFLGSNLQWCLHATVLLAVKYSAELNK